MSHYIKKNHRTSLPQHIIAIDTETIDDKSQDQGVERHRLLLGCLIYRRWDNGHRSTKDYSTSTYRFDNHSSLDNILYSILKKTRKRYYIFAHNANFDYSIIDINARLCNLGLKTEFYVNEKPPVIVKTKAKDISVLWLDSLNFFRMSLSQLGDSLGLISKSNMPNSSDLNELYEYCKNDTEILIEALTKWRMFVSDNNLGNFAVTLASQSLNAFRHRFMPERTLVQTSKEDVLLKERKTYFGGRTECFYNGTKKGDFYMLDINSMYPYVMQKHSYPVRYVTRHNNFNPYKYTFSQDIKPGMATVELTLDKPVLPMIIEGRLCFPIGRLNGTWTYPELKYARPYISDITFIDVYMYRHKPIFTQWVTELYALRQQFKSEGNIAYSTLVKLLMNSLYGKFGQLTPVWENIEPTTLPDNTEGFSEDPYTKEIIHWRVRMGILQHKSERIETSHSMPLIAAHVTAYGRNMLFSLIEKAGIANVYYCDTDSVLVNSKGYTLLKRLISDTTLGALGIEWNSSFINIHGLKDYEYQGGKKIKGVKANAKQLNDNVFTQKQFRSWDYHQSKGERGFIDIIEQRKELKRIYTKGILHSNGRIIPHTVNA